jgi:predicted transcriptional regulator
MEITMRALVDIEDTQIQRLDELARRQKRSRAAVIRQALREYIDASTAQSADEAFGLWGDRAVDGLEYQERIRSEW